MIKYPYAVNDIAQYDLTSLEAEVRINISELTAIHAGSGALVLEFTRVLTVDEVVTVKGILAAHSPIWFTWTEGVARKVIVRSAEDVDKITNQRIRRIVGGHDAIQEQLKMLRLSVWSLDTQTNPTDYTAAEKTKAAQIRQTMLNIHTRIEVIIQEGKTFKVSRGWA